MSNKRPLRIILFVSITLAACLSCSCSAPRSSQQPAANSDTATERKAGNSCSLLTVTEITAAVGNAVNKGEVEGNSDVCKWRTEDPRNVDVLLIFREKGSTREHVLCQDLQNSTGERIAGLGEVAIWKFSQHGLFNSGDLEVCGPKGYVNITLNGARDEATLKPATINLTQKILQRL